MTPGGLVLGLTALRGESSTGEPRLAIERPKFVGVHFQTR